MADNVLRLLKKDHEKVREILNELVKTTERAGKTRQKLLNEIAMDIEVHTRLEEEIFYPAFEGKSKKREDQLLYHEALEEHHAADNVLNDLRKADPASWSFSGKAKVLRELVMHHIHEEEKEMFPRARELMSEDELKEVGEQLMQRKEQLLQGYKKSQAAA